MNAARCAWKKWAGRMFLLGVVWTGPGVISAQELPTGVSPTDPAAVSVADPPAMDPAPPLMEEGNAPCEVGCKEKQPFWATVPYPYYWPPLGWAFRRPEGPGYYSLWDMVTGNYREKPPPYPWPPFGLDIVPFYDANFQYLDKPGNTERDFIFDHTKRLHPTDNWMFSIGGEERIRYDSEPDSRLTGKYNQYELERTRIYTDIWYRDIFRVYVEFNDAEAFNYRLTPLSIDRDRDDLLNAFADLKIGTFNDEPIYARVGRQELIYGSERLITTKDWANVLQTFQGIKEWYRSANLDFDTFYVQPVVPNAAHFASIDDKQGFAGMWLTYRPAKVQTLDLYVLNLENRNTVTTQSFLAEKGGRGGYNVTTLGARSYGEERGFLWDFEGMYQLGDFTNAPIEAGAFALGVGWHFKDLPTGPSFWIYDEWASGTDNPGHGPDHTFNQLFPYAHYYLGWLDLVGRQNINDFNMELQSYPCNWITVLLQYHLFNLDSAKDALYGVGSQVERRDPTGKAGRDVGDEFDFLVSFHVGPHSDILVGYSYLWAGEFIKKTGPGENPSAFYIQYSFRW